MMTIFILLLSANASFATDSKNENGFSENYNNVLHNMFIIYSDLYPEYPELADQYPYLDVSDKRIAEFVDKWVSAYNGNFDTWGFRRCYIIPNDSGISLHEFLEKLTQLQQRNYEFSKTTLYNQECFRIDFNTEIHNDVTMLSLIERIYILGTLYAYLEDQGDCHIHFELCLGSTESNYNEYKKDVNYDGAFNVKDIQCLKKYIAGMNERYNLNALDQNSDGVINIMDLSFIKKAMAGN